jgi:rhamnosyltransferase
MNRILAIVVTYYPDRVLLEKNISAFIEDVDRVLIWENTPAKDKLAHRFIEHEKVEYCGDGSNSISHALNFAWQKARMSGYDYVLTMDQDSVWEDFHAYLEQTICNSKAPSGIWGPNAYEDVDLNGIQEYDKIITSGMLLKVEFIDQVGGWNEFFPIDCVDDDFCLRAKRKGIRCHMFGMCRLHQQFGSPKKVSFLGHSSIICYDSPKRLYSIYKYHVILVRMFPEMECVKSELLGYWKRLIKWYVIGGAKPIRNFFAIFSGIISGIICKIGRM